MKLRLEVVGSASLASYANGERSSCSYLGDRFAPCIGQVLWSHADAHVFICFGRRVRRSQRRGARFFEGPWHTSTVGGRKGHKEASRSSDGNEHQPLGADGDPSGSSAAEPGVHPEMLGGQGGLATGDIASDERQKPVSTSKPYVSALDDEDPGFPMEYDSGMQPPAVSSMSNFAGFDEPDLDLSLIHI